MYLNIILIIATNFALLISAIDKLPTAEENQIVERFYENYPNARIGNTSRLQKSRENILKRYYEINEHNQNYKAGNETFEMELNDFSILSHEDLVRRLGFVEEPLSSTYQSENENEAELPEIVRTSEDLLPDFWNWADHGIVQPVQDQGNCGSCYAFAAIGVIESSMCRYFGSCVKLSEQEAMECTNGCNGGM